MRFHQLDSLRLFFALVVVAGHVTGWSKFVRNGGIAVDFFFVLSGFVISHLIIEKTPSFATFSSMRLARLWPLHILTMLAIMPMISPVSNWEFWANVMLLQNVVIFERLSMNVPSWSISAELVVGLTVLYGLVRSRAIMPAAALVCLCLCIEMQSSVRIDQLHSQPFGLLAFGLIRCAMGSALGYLTYELYLRTRGAILAPAAVDLMQVATFGAFLVLMATPLTNVGRLAMIGLAALMVLLFSRSGKFVAVGLENPTLTKLGSLSFAVYLVHFPLLCAFIRLGFLPVPQMVAKNGPAIYSLPILAFFATVLGTAFLARVLVEVPCNSALVKLLKDIPWRIILIWPNVKARATT